MGYAEMARRVWPSLVSHYNMGAVDIGMQPSSVDLGKIAKEINATCRHNSPDFSIVNMVPILWDKLCSTKKVGWTTFEADPIPKDWVDICNKLPAVITTSEWNKQVFIQSGVKIPVIVLTPTFDKVDWKPSNVETFKVFSSFQWSARKNPEGVIRAFAGAFEGKDAQLVLKTHIGSPKEKTELETNIKDVISKIPGKPPKIRVVTGNMSSHQIKKLAMDCHAHISLSFGEGWGLPAWEAAEISQPTVLTNWGAYSDWSKDSSLLVRSDTQPPYGMDTKVSPFFNGKMRWGDPSLSDAIDKLKFIYGNYDKALAEASQLSKQLALTYTIEKNLKQLELLDEYT